MAGLEITVAQVQQFRSNVFPLAQQTLSRFRRAVMEDLIVGESGYMEQLAPDDMVDVTSEHADTPVFPGGWMRRRIVLTDADWGKLIDKQQQIRLLVDPEGAYVNRRAPRSAARSTSASPTPSSPPPTRAIPARPRPPGRPARATASRPGPRSRSIAGPSATAAATRP